MKTLLTFFKKSVRTAGWLIVTFLFSMQVHAQDLRWAKQIESAKELTVLGIDTDNSGNSYVIGQFIGQVGFSSNWPGTNYPMELLGADDNDQDVFIAKYNPQGECVFISQLGNPTTADGKARQDQAKAIAVSKDGKHIYVSATIAADALGEVLTVPGLRDEQLTGGKGSDIVIVRYDQDPEDEDWYDPMKAFNIGTDGSADNAFSITADDAGNVYLCGGHRGRLNYSPKGLTAKWGTRPPSGYNFLWMAKYAMATTKECVWFYEKQNLKDNSVIEARKVLLAGNKIYLTGLMRGNVVFGSTPDTTKATLAVGGGASKTMRDVFFASFTNLTDTISFDWVKLIGKSGMLDNESKDLAVDAQSRVYISGNLNGTANLDGRSENALSINGKDVFLARYMSDGTFNYLRTFGSQKDDIARPKVFGNWDEARGMQIDASGNIFLSGSFEGMNVNLDPMLSNKAVFTSNIAAGDTTYTRNSYIAKYNENGSLIWGRQISGKDQLYGVSCALAGGDIITTGSFLSNCKFDATTELTNLSGTNNIYIAKYAGNSDTGIANGKENELRIYADKNLLHIVNAPAIGKIGIYAVNGSFVKEAAVKETIDISGLGKGLFLVRMTAPNQTISAKIVR
ncbi:MAG: hypothetical protein PHR38_00245 [Bacteroidales bacterium]|nr:hypothetical protein [Bacteroidales bacterium]MDD3906585.1 hypothetical protein [Bacteroidales bacterium]MDD4711814.1 hypothetical protein [Bacteroidales bacterium]